MSSQITDVLIVGAGAFGLSCAWHMARRDAGARILVLDEGESRAAPPVATALGSACNGDSS
jgi:glycine/D-amino acid oxidase-like deaminating enzyme